MTEPRRSHAEPLVLHVIPTPLARGAQREARALADQLDLPGVRAHRVLSLFDGPPEVAVDFSLHLPDGSRPAEGYDPRHLRRLRTALARFNPALVVAHGSDPLKYLVPAMLGTRRPLAYYAIGTYAGDPGRRLQLAMWRWLVSHADVVAAEGDEVRAQCTELLNVPADKVTMTPNGRDPDEYAPRSTPGDQPPKVTFLGACTTGKRPDRFVEVIAAVRGRGVDLRAELIGDGPLWSSIQEPAHAARVELLGSRSDVADLLRRSDLMVFPSLPAGEGMPGVLIEAGLSGLPVVATDVPGVRTVIEDGVTGFIVGVDDRGAMEDRVSELLTDHDLRAAMGAAARQRCLERFSLDAVATLWIELLGPLLPASGPR